MKASLAYGKTGLSIELPDKANVRVLEPTYVQGCPDPTAAIQKALRQPIGARPIQQLIQPGDVVGIVFSDITRPTPNDLLLPILLEELRYVPTQHIALFNGTGTHRPNTADELRQMLGDDIMDQYQILQNDAYDVGSHVRVGVTSSGNDIWLHRAFVACDAKILTGFIEPHFFAGFSGGGKAVMPGLARLDSVMRNHSAEHLDNPSARWGIRQGNPLWADIHDAASMVEPTFLVNVTLNRDKQITEVFAGDWDEAHARGCAFVRQSAMVPVEAPFDIVITSNSGYPLDLNVYQTVKGMSAAAQVVKEGGSIIVAAECWDGIPDHGDYARLLYEADDVASLLARVRDPDCSCQDTWQAHTQALVSQRADIYLYSHNLSDEEIKNALLIPCRNIGDTVGKLLERQGPEATICVLPEGPQTVPYVSSR